LKTRNSQRGFKRFFSDYNYLTSDGAAYLAKAGVALVGIDAWSIKQRGNKDNTPHTALLKKNIVILETIDLSKVKPGSYFLVLLPLRIEGRDGAPARAILIQD
jgi:arylformamidase